MGFDAAVQEMTAPKSKAAGIILAADVSPKTEKEICFHAEKCGTPVVHGDFTMDDAKDAVGKRTGIFLCSTQDYTALSQNIYQNPGGNVSSHRSVLTG